MTPTIAHRRMTFSIPYIRPARTCVSALGSCNAVAPKMVARPRSQAAEFSCTRRSGMQDDWRGAAHVGLGDANGSRWASSVAAELCHQVGSDRLSLVGR